MADGDPNTIDLVVSAKKGSATAENLLYSRVMPRFLQWASGRLPGKLRGADDTADMAQEVYLGFRRNMEGFDPQRDGGVHAYLRRAFMNRIKDKSRQFRPQDQVSDDDVVTMRSPYEECIAGEIADAYERALDKLTNEEREAVIMRVELHYDYDRIAAELERPNPNAARAYINRILIKLARFMKVHDE